MTIVVDKRVWTKQPQRVVRVNRSNHFSDSLVDFDTLAMRHSAVLNSFLDFPTTNCSIGVGIGGSCVDIDAGNYGPQYVNDKYNIAAPFTFVVAFTIRAAGTGGRLAGPFVSGVSGFGFLPTSTNFRTGHAAGSNALVTGSALRVGTYEVHAITMSSGGNHRAYENGIYVGNSGAAYTPPSAGKMFLGRDAAPSSAISCKIFGWWLFNRQFSDSEVAAFVQNPYIVCL